MASCSSGKFLNRCRSPVFTQGGRSSSLRTRRGVPALRAGRRHLRAPSGARSLRPAGPPGPPGRWACIPTAGGHSKTAKEGISSAAFAFSFICSCRFFKNSGSYFRDLEDHESKINDPPWPLLGGRLIFSALRESSFPPALENQHRRPTRQPQRPGPAAGLVLTRPRGGRCALSPGHVGRTGGVLWALRTLTKYSSRSPHVPLPLRGFIYQPRKEKRFSVKSCWRVYRMCQKEIGWNKAKKSSKSGSTLTKTSGIIFIYGEKKSQKLE